MYSTVAFLDGTEGIGSSVWHIFYFLFSSYASWLAALAFFNFYLHLICVCRSSDNLLGNKPVMKDQSCPWTPFSALSRWRTESASSLQ